MRKILVVVSLLFCLVSVSSCAGKGYGYTETESPPAASAGVGMDLGGRTVNILSTASGFVMDEISPEGSFSEKVNDAILRRNRDTELELNCDIVTEQAASVFDAVRADFTSGDGRYDIVVSDLSSGVALLYGGYLAQLGQIGSVDLSESFWDPDFISASSAFGKNYLAMGDFDLSLYRSAYVTFVNTDALGGKLYDRLCGLVTDGTFTVDKQIEIASAVYSDINGNSIRDGEDVFGYGTNRAGCADALFGAFGLEIISRNVTGELAVTADVDAISSAYERIYELCTLRQTFTSDGNEGIYELTDMLFCGQLAMASLPLIRAEKREQTDGISVLPLPKLDDSQSTYFSFPADEVTVSAIPANAKDREGSGALLSVLYSRSRRDVLPRYFDYVTCGRYSENAVFGDFFSLALDRFCFDEAYIHSEYLGGFASGLVSSRLLSGDVDNSAACSACVKALARQLPELNELLRSLG